MIVYKYLPPKGIRVLNDGLIRFTQSTALNDPFETTPNMKRLEESFREYALRTIEGAKYRSIIEYVSDRSRVSSLIKKHFDEFRRTITNNYAVLSLSKINNNLLMWAH